MRVLWVHNFDPADPLSGIFMKQMVAPLKVHGVDVDLYYIGRLRKNLLHLPSAIKKLKKAAEGYDLVHAQYGSLTGFVTSYITSTKLISLRGSDWHRIKSFFPLFDYFHGLGSTLLTKLALKKFQHVITMSERMSNRVQSKHPNVAVRTLMDAIDLKNFKAIDHDEARKTLNIPHNEKWVMFAAVLNGNPIKRAYLAQESVSIAQKTMPDIVFKPLYNIAHEDMPLYYSAASALITTSVHEGWPNCVKEALACNLPFIATDTSDLRLIADQEQTCHVCEADSQELAQAILSTLKQERPKNLRRHMQPHTMTKYTSDLANIYKDILSGADHKS